MTEETIWNKLWEARELIRQTQPHLTTELQADLTTADSYIGSVTRILSMRQEQIDKGHYTAADFND